GQIYKKQDKYHINDDSGRFVELCNAVFMQYILNEDLKWEKIKQRNIDFGGGLERDLMAIQKKEYIFQIDIYEPILEKVKEISGKEYLTNGKENEFTRSFRIIADHARAATFIIADGVIPSNKDQGYILRRVIRRLVRFGKNLGINKIFAPLIAEVVIERMKEVYPHLLANKEIILTEVEKEEVRFKKTLDRGLNELEKIKKRGKEIDGKKAFYIYTSFGFPLELTLDELDIDEKKRVTLNLEGLMHISREGMDFLREIQQLVILKGPPAFMKIDRPETDKRNKL
ncbi:MAG: alanine--tRNA ligase-related protein, partial [Candidatus Bathyarchaeia archaeon]